MLQSKLLPRPLSTILFTQQAADPNVSLQEEMECFETGGTRVHTSNNGEAGKATATLESSRR